MGQALRLLVIASLPFLCSCTTSFAPQDVDGTELCSDGTLCPNDPYVRLSKERYAVNEAIVVQYGDLPGAARDWIGLFAAGSPNEEYLRLFFTDGKVVGSVKFQGLSAGSYEARLFFDGSYQLEDKASFQVAN